jgi:hypothetical protein
MKVAESPRLFVSHEVMQNQLSKLFHCSGGRLSNQRAGWVVYAIEKGVSGATGTHHFGFGCVRLMGLSL